MILSTSRISRKGDLGMASTVAPAMWGGDDHVVQPDKAGVGGEGLGVKDIQGGPGDGPAAQRLQQVPLVHQPAPGGVDKVGGGLHQRKIPFVNGMFGLRSEPQMEADDVGLTEDVLQARNDPYVTQPVALQPFPVQIAVIGDHRDPHGLQTEGHLDAHVAQPGQAHRQVAEGGGEAGVGKLLHPGPLNEAPVGGGDVSGEVQHQSQGKFGHRHRVADDIDNGDVPL